MTIDRISRQDVEEVVALERACGLSSMGVEAYLSKLEDPRELLLVARVLDSPASTRVLAGVFTARLVLDELQIDNIAVANHFRRNGIARELLVSAMRLALELGGRRAFLEARASNSPALRLYRQAGFEQIGHRKNYYNNPPEDAIVLASDLPGIKSSKDALDR